MTPVPGQTIELSTRIAAPARIVFRFFSDPQRYKLWMGDQSTVDPGPRGRLTVSFGPGPTAIGRIVEWVEPTRIVFDWSHEGSTTPASRVTITLHESSGFTEVTLRHEGIVEAAQREGTSSGWRYYLSNLGNVALAEQLAESAPKAIAEYLGAWSKADASARLKALAGCVSQQVRFRDRYGSVNGCQALSDYIGGVQRMMGPAKLNPDGPLDRVHSFFRQNWSISASGPAGGMRGQNVYEFDEQGKLILILGFWV